MAESNPNPIAGDDEEQEEGGQVVLFNATREKLGLSLIGSVPFMAESNPNPIAGDDEEQEEGGQVVLFNATREKLGLSLIGSVPFMAESSPNPIGGDDEEQEEGGQVVLFNATRHEHELLLFEGLPTYTCSGCKEKGANIGYKCNINSDRPSSSCKNFTLHELCATLPDAYQHPFLSDVSFKFRPKTIFPHRCNACWDEVKGYVFETERRHLRPELRLHPLCMALPKILDYSRHANHKLKFVTGDLKDKEYTCSVCDSQIESGGWRYRCEEVACKVYVDLSCAKIDIFGLSDHGIQRIAPVSRSRSRRGSVATFVKSVMNGVVYALNN